MKKISVMVITLTCLLLMMSEVQASSQLGRVWQYSSSPAGLPAFLKAMQAAGKVTGTGRNTRLDNQFLAENMFINAKEKGFLNLVPAKFRTKEAYAKLVRNSVVGMKSQAMLLDYFKSKGQGSGFYLLGTFNVFQKVKMMEADVSALKRLQQQGYAVSMKQIKSAQADLTALTAEVRKTNRQVSKLEAQVTASAGSIKSLDNDVSDLGNQFEALSDKNNKTQRVVKKLTGRVATLEAQSVQVTANKAAVTELMSTMDEQDGMISILGNELNKTQGALVTLQSDTVTKLQTLKADVSDQLSATKQEVKRIDGQYEYIVYSLLISVGLVAIAMFWLGWKQRKTSQVVQRQGVESNHLTRGLGNIQERVEEQTNEIKLLKESVNKYSFDESLVTPENLAKIPVGKSVKVDLTSNHEGELSLSLEVERTGSNQITIHGALRQVGQASPMVIDSLRGVANKIHRAARNNRIVGVSHLTAVV